LASSVREEKPDIVVMTRGGIRVSPLREEDLESFLPLIAAYQRFYGRYSLSAATNRVFFGRFIEPSEHGVLLGAWTGSNPAGFATLYWTFSSTAACAVAVMNDLYVDEAHRRKGIGRALVDSAVSAAIRRGMVRLDWLAAADNLEAQGFYKALGARHSLWVEYSIPLLGDR
jgi:GNAT superfamily N-acetyltransferase